VSTEHDDRAEHAGSTESAPGGSPGGDRSGESPEPSRGSRSSWRGAARFVARHPLGVAQGIVFALVAIVVLQNLEPTSIDILFWSVPGFPKLVLILVSMVVGAAAWEIVRRLLPR
jgi:uncharacterized integral membrane protein